VPIIVMSLRGGIRSLRQPNLAGYVESIAMFIGICITSVLVFHQSHPPSQSPVLMCAPLPILLWAAIRRGVPAVSFCVVILAMFAIVGVINDRGPFVAENPETATRAVQAFLIISASSLMLLAASLSELKSAKAHALWQMESLQLALGAAKMGTWEWNMIQDQIAYRYCAPSEEETGLASSTSLVALLDRVETNDRVQLTRAMSKAMRRRGSSEVEFRLRRDDGTFRWISIRGKVIRHGKSKPDRMIGVYSDITQQKSEEAQLAAQREQLARVKRIASLGELSASLAHELTQPLTAILSNAQAARRTLAGSNPDPEQLDQTLEDIVSQGRRIVEVIRRLRALLLKGELQVQPADANKCIREVLFLEQKVLRAKGIAVGARLCSTSAAVMIDRIQLQQVLMNLIANACDAMAGTPPDQRHIEITSRGEADHSVKIEISDTGPGIEDTESIFEPFFTTKHRGIGLGLSICRTIIAAHSGRLWASNNATRGATLHIWLPPESVATSGLMQARTPRLDQTPQPTRGQVGNSSQSQMPPYAPPT
jgi:C4-dicarboxylate-specific signal transduction histidine kinase